MFTRENNSEEFREEFDTREGIGAVLYGLAAIGLAIVFIIGIIISLVI